MIPDSGLHFSGHRVCRWVNFRRPLIAIISQESSYVWCGKIDWVDLPLHPIAWFDSSDDRSVFRRFHAMACTIFVMSCNIMSCNFMSDIFNQPYECGHSLVNAWRRHQQPVRNMEQIQARQCLLAEYRVAPRSKPLSRIIIKSYKKPSMRLYF